MSLAPHAGWCSQPHVSADDYWPHQHVNVFPGCPPPDSPNLNPIEMLWTILKSGRHSLGGSIEEEVLAAWDGITQETIDALVGSSRHRCEMVLKVGGSSTSRYLSSHMEPPYREHPDHEISEYQAEVDVALLSLGPPGVIFAK